MTKKENATANNAFEEKVTQESTALAETTNASSNELIDALKASKNFLFSSIQNDGTRKTAVKIYNAINGDCEKISEHLKEKIEVVDIIAHPIELLNDETGELESLLRCVFIDKDGVCYESCAKGVYSSLQKLFPLVGMPSYNPPLSIVAKEKKTRNGYKVIVITLDEI